MNIPTQFTPINNILNIFECVLLDFTDSCFAENKNKNLYNFYCCLVMTNRIHAANLSYGQVGHSHGLCDAGFGSISTKLRKTKNLTNYEQFTQLLQNLKFQNIVGDTVYGEQVDILTKVYDW